MSSPVIDIQNVGKEFVLHAQDGTRLPVFSGASIRVSPGECIALSGPSGIGKSSLMRMLYGNFRCATGSLNVLHRAAWVDIATAHPHIILDVRRYTMGYVSQFLRVIPRVATLDIVKEPALAQGMDADEAEDRARAALSNLNIPERLWSLSPVTFSGGEQQRVNLARGFCARYPILLLDEPTASLDQQNRETVLQMIRTARDEGAAILGIFHDSAARDALCTGALDMSKFQVKAA